MPFITFEGVEGSGKSTQLELLAERLSGRGLSVRKTREPGGTALGARLRALLLDPAQRDLDPFAEFLLFEADRRQHLREVVRPGLASGAWVLCDRFSDSTEAYQSAGRGIDPKIVSDLDERVRGGVAPDMTLLFDVDPAEGLARTRRRDAREGRFESETLAFHERVSLAFHAIARREPERVAIVDARDDVAS
ncbi:MAG TPA: dTMP kinase, partial [Thermoanaerobaculia bacterium]|nr:dTMP kinase [Thermoanaerobaculia bacterium]